MKLKEVYDLITGVALIVLPDSKEIEYGNACLPAPTPEIMEMEVEEIEPFYKRTGLWKFGVIIRLKEH